MKNVATKPVSFASDKRKRAPTKRIKETPLNESDWAHAATDILVNESVQGIRIGALCKKLGVTKGSFYWHFDGRADLLKAMLQHWRHRMTTNVIDRLGQEHSDAVAKLRALLKLPRRTKSPEFAQIEQSIRDWGRRSGQTRDVVKAVDEIRLGYFAELFVAQGMDTETARRRAYIAYAMMMGDSVLQNTLDIQNDESIVDDVIIMLTDMR